MTMLYESKRKKIFPPSGPYFVASCSWKHMNFLMPNPTANLSYAVLGGKQSFCTEGSNFQDQDGSDWTKSANFMNCMTSASRWFMCPFH